MAELEAGGFVREMRDNSLKLLPDRTGTEIYPRGKRLMHDAGALVSQSPALISTVAHLRFRRPDKPLHEQNIMIWVFKMLQLIRLV